MRGLRGLKDKNKLWLISTIVIFIDILSKILFKNFLLLVHKNKIIDNFYNNLKDKEKYKEYFEHINKYLKEMITC